MRSLSEIVKANREAKDLGVNTAVDSPVGVNKPGPGAGQLSPERMEKLGLDKY